MFAGGHENKGPSIAEIQRLIRDRSPVEFFLANGERIAGRIKWFDEFAFCVITEGEDPVTILRPAVMAYHVITNNGSKP